MIAKYYGKNIKIQSLRRYCQINREGVSMLGLCEAAEKIGLKSMAGKITMKRIKDMELPCILHWRQSHFIVLYKIKKRKYYIADPGIGLISISEPDFEQNWIDGESKEQSGLILLLSPTQQFGEKSASDNSEVKWSFLLKYFITYKKLFFQLIIGLSIASLLQLIAPFFTQAIVDIGINNKNLSFINIILIAQFTLVIGRVSVEFIRSWLLLHISTRINVSILTDFLIKLMKLPMGFFDTKMTGDIMQRMNDQKKIESFLTGSTLTTIFSFFNLLIFSIILAYYNVIILLVFIFSCVLYITWISIFLDKRRHLNYKNFSVAAQNQSAIVQLISGMQEIKLNNCELKKRWQWEHIQAKLFNFNVKNLTLNQYQQAGSTFINEGSNLIITFLSARAVVLGDLSLGGMMAVQYIVGQLNAPIHQFLGFIQGYQDAKISLERLNDIHQMDDEPSGDIKWDDLQTDDRSITIKNLTFRYPGVGNEAVIQNINLKIDHSKTTAIVGMSGSGKTTLMKLLLRFYAPEQGEIRIGDQSFNEIDQKDWRKQCGTVMQDGFIFSDTIENNIAVGETVTDKQKLLHAIRIANIEDMITTLPLGLNTKIGSEGNGISQGQRQRILIARSVYKNPEYIFFDEATNSLDSNNERTIINNLKSFFDGRTVVIIAHRLSTIMYADKIVVLKKGKISEQGSHRQLIDLKGDYYQLVRNQLELVV